jgi:hypothetical protein
MYLEGGFEVQILATVASVIVGATVGTITVFGLVNSATGPSGTNPANVEAPMVDYGTETP